MDFEKCDKKPIWFLLIFSLSNFIFVEAGFLGYLLLFNLIIAIISTGILFIDSYEERKKTPLKEEIEINEREKLRGVNKK